VKYSAKGNNYKHGDDVKYIQHGESIFTRSSQKHNNNNNNNNRYIGLEIYACCRYAGGEKHKGDFGGDA